MPCGQSHISGYAVVTDKKEQNVKYMNGNEYWGKVRGSRIVLILYNSISYYLKF